MGFKRKKKVYRLTFDAGHELEGLVALVHAPPLGFFDTAMKAQGMQGKRADQLTPEDAELVSDFLGGFAEHLIEWNLEDDNDVPVPATPEGVRAQDIGFVLDVTSAWLDAVQAVAPPLGQPSNSGKPSLVASLPMEPLSASPQSSSGPSLSSAAASDSAASQVS